MPKSVLRQSRADGLWEEHAVSPVWVPEEHPDARDAGKWA